MCKHLVSMTRNLGIISVLVFILVVIIVGVHQVNSQENSPNFIKKESDVFAIEPPTLEEPKWQSEVPALTVEQEAELKYWIENTQLSGPVIDEEASSIVGPEEGTESKAPRRRSKQPQAPESAKLFQNVDFGSIIPAGFRSNTQECSVGVGGKYVFYTGNWFAARSINGGSTWSYVNAYSDFNTFCCDQVAIYDESRNLFFWLRQGNPSTNATTKNYENVFKLGVSSNGGSSFCTYTFKPTDIDSSWTNQWWDYPHIQLGADYLYITWNMYDNTTPVANAKYTRSVIIRFPLDTLATCSGGSGNQQSTTDWVTLVPIQGADHTMYYASNWPTTSPQNSRIAIWKWDEDSTSVASTVKDITAWSITSKASATCGATTGNWAARIDSRLLTGARYNINGKNIKVPGRKVLGWWWSVKQDANFSNPYVDAAAFYEDTLEQVSGGQGRPYIHDPSVCYSYPSVAVNQRGDLGLIVHYGSGASKNPSIGYAMADNFVDAPPGWSLYNVKTSNGRPADNKWGDYNTVRVFDPSHDIWAGAAHYISSATGTGTPVYFSFGRERDTQSWNYWYNK